jgi:hypothetical protein
MKGPGKQIIPKNFKHMCIPKAKFVSDVIVGDPDSNDDVSISIYKHENGYMFGIENSFIDHVLTDDGDEIIVPDIFSNKFYIDFCKTNDFVKLIK